MQSTFFFIEIPTPCIHIAVKCCIWIWMRNLTGGTKEVPLLSTARDLKKPHQALLENITHDAIVLSSMWRSFRPFPSTWGNFTTHNFVIALLVKNSEIGQNFSNSAESDLSQGRSAERESGREREKKMDWKLKLCTVYKRKSQEK